MRRYPKEHDDLLDCLDTGVKQLIPPDWTAPFDPEKAKAEFRRRGDIGEQLEDVLAREGDRIDAIWNEFASV